MTHWDFKHLWTEHMWGESFGKCTLDVYESTMDPWNFRSDDDPYVVVWLHGMHQGPADAYTLRRLQRRLHRRVIFVCPTNPEPSWDGMEFSWGCTFTKAQNKQDLGYVNGDLSEPFLSALTRKVNQTADHVRAERVLVMGYSMGGFGALQLGCHAPETYDAVVSVAGYGMGTQESTYHSGAPQPKGRHVFQWFLDQQVPRLADVPIVLGVHCKADYVSSYRDVNTIVKKVQDTAWHSGKRCYACMLQVPAGEANSDQGRNLRTTASGSGHGYFNVTLLKDKSEDFVWAELRHQLSRAAKRLRAHTAERSQSSRAHWKRGRDDDASDWYETPSKRWRWR